MTSHLPPLAAPPGAERFVKLERFEPNPTVADQGQKLKIFSAAELASIQAPERRWLVPDMIPMARTTLLYGNGGDGKSLLALQLAVSVVTGNDWIGRLVEQGPALMLSCEDDIEEIHRRLEAVIAGRTDLDLDDLDALKILDLAGEDAILSAADNKGILKPSLLFTKIQHLVDELRPVMICIDTLADVYGGDENVRSQVRQFLGFLNGLAIKHNMAVVVLAHPSLSGIASGTGAGGSTAWSNSVRSRLYLAPVKVEEGALPDPTLKTLTVMKSNYGPTGETISLRYSHGRFVLAGGEWKASASAAEVDIRFLELLDQFSSEGRNVTMKKGTSYAPHEFARHADARGITKDAFRQAMDRLLKAGKIRSFEDGSPSRRRSKLIAVENFGDDQA